MKEALRGSGESIKAATPLPARVAVVPLLYTARRRWLNVSATTSAAEPAKEPPPTGTVSPYILPKRAFVPSPSAVPDVSTKPARGDTTPAGVATRTTKFCESPMYTNPLPAVTE